MKRAVFAVLLAPAVVAAGEMEMDLTGRWSLSDCERTIEAEVPGGVHDALLAKGLIPDPYYGENEKEILWVARRDWTFSRTFNVSEEMLAHKEVILRLEDCDTFATISINGREAGKTANRFRRYDFDVKSLLKPGENTIAAAFRSPVAEADERREKLGRAYPISNALWAKNQALIRKPACHAGWDWGPEIESIGLCGTVKLIARDAPGIDYIRTKQDFNSDLSHCTLTVYADLSDGTTVTNRLEIPNPPLWWPRGEGPQNFFTFAIDVAGRKVVRRIGLRKLEIVNEKDADGLSFYVRVNNRPVFMKGANWIPCDALERRQTPGRYRQLLESAAAANMNMIRVWGGGQYEKDVFYDLCDRLGLLVWHDMMCACAVYPADDEFLGEIRQELAHQLRRLQSRASIALWCGDNECLGAIRWFEETRADPEFYRQAWVARSKMQGEMVAKYDPERTYWPSSPCCGPGDFGNAWKDDSKGDMHQWSVWHENKPFECYYNYRPRFCSEFGFQSFSSPEVAKTFSPGPGEAFEWHQKNDGGNRRIRETMLRYFGPAKDFESELLLSQFQQAMAIETALTAWRTARPRTMGTLYWQLNDNWPVASWSSIEYGGKWKPLHYAAKRLYAPLAVVAKKDGTVCAVNDTAKPISATLDIEYWRYDGERPLRTESKKVSIAAAGVTELGKIEFEDGTFAYIELYAKGHGVMSTAFHKIPFRDAPLADPELKLEEAGTSVGISCKRPAFFVWLEGQEEFCDNAFTLVPGHPVAVRAPKGGVSATSLYSTLLRSTRKAPVNGRLRGFNLLDMVFWNGGDTPHFKESDFALIREWGFNFARLPIDYRHLDTEEGFKALDEAIAFARKHGIHVQLCLHRLPGYCSGGLLPGEKSLFDDEATLRKACKLWRTIAERYKAIPSKELSFNLFNEPEYIDEAKYTPVAKALAGAIREISPDRFLVADGLGYGRIAPMSLAGEENLGFSWHCYDPFFVTHHKTPWNDPSSVSEPPRWPVDARDGRTWLMEETYHSKGWADAARAGVFCHAGEFGVWRETPHDVALGLMEDQLKLWRELDCGWALWGLYGGFGVMDSGRADVQYEDFRGHKLDRKLLELLRQY